MGVTFMLKKYIGRNRAENLDWLVNVWLTTGPPVCFLQGFSGVGKTDLARDLRDAAQKRECWEHTVINEISDRPTPSVIEGLMELSASLSRQGLPEMERVLFEETSPNLAFALEEALSRPVVIILDEAQRFFMPDSGSPLPELNNVVSFLRNRQNLPGRLLLLSDRLVENARWSEWIPKRTLTKLEPEEAIEALESKLEDSDVVLDELPERKQDLVKALDYNPRAIEALVGALAYDSLDEIMGSKPGLWETKDRVVSREFLDTLERDLLERTLKHLDMAHQKKLWRLAVHRRSFKREALERTCGSKDEAARLRTILITRYLINFRSGVLSLNPIVREISLSHLKEEPAEYKQAHSGAADYHLRHFKAKHIVGSQATLGESFAEVRYHLVQAGREAEIREIGHRFTDHLKHEIRAVSPVPRHPEELDERIGVLSVLLEGGGAKGLEYHLARCLQTRGRVGDIERAIIHAERAASGGGPEVSWTLLVKLQHQAVGVDAAMRTIRNALRTRHHRTDAAPLYRLGAELLSGAGKTDEAVVLLKEGLRVIPANKNLFSLYQSCAEMLGRAGKTGEAVVLLKEGLRVIPADKNLFSLYQSCAEMLGLEGKTDEAVVLLKEGIKVPGMTSLFSLYQSCAEMLGRAGKTDEAVVLLKEGLRVIPADKNLFSLYQSCAEMLGRAGKMDEAVVLLKEGLRVIPADKNLFSLYQSCAEMLGLEGKTDEAVVLLKEGIKVPGMTSLSSLYQSCAEMLGRAGKTDEAVALLKEGLRVIPAGKNLFSLYQSCAEMLGLEGKTDEAVVLLKEGIKVPGMTSLFSLYQSCAEMLGRAGKTDEAVALLKEGIEVPGMTSHSSLYQSCAEILGRAGKTDEAVVLLKEGLRVIPAGKNLFSLYQSCAEMLGRAGKTDEAVALLKEGIKVPGMTSLSSLYQSCAEILGRAGKTDEAVVLLKEGLRVIPADKNLFSLYQSLGEVFCRAGKPSEAIAVQIEGLKRIPEQFGRQQVVEGALLLCVGAGESTQLANLLAESGPAALSRSQVTLGRVLECQDRGDWAGAAELAKSARVEFPRYFALAAQEALSRLASRDSEGAHRALSEFPHAAFGRGETSGWLAAFIHLRRGARSEACDALAAYLGRPADERQELSETYLLRLWDQQETSREDGRLCFHFPIIPASLTGLKQDVRRFPFAAPVLPFQPGLITVSDLPPAPVARTTAPEIYVSYAWGEDSSASGRQREEIVDRLCAAVEKSGRVIGRDKERMRGGDSIEHFAQEVARAKRIVAVISEKSLHSEFCMAHELFQAFRRCAYHRAEFQEKVIALVMDDATPLLNDNHAIVALTKVWQGRLEKFRAELQDVDPTRKSTDLWVFVDLMEEMCPRLPAMLGALKDIVMKRGFEEIVKDGFREVLDRLPARTEA